MLSRQRQRRHGCAAQPGGDQRDGQQRRPERKRGGRMVEERECRRDSRGAISPVRRQADGADRRAAREGARRRLVLQREHRRAGDHDAERADRGDQRAPAKRQVRTPPPAASAPRCRARASRSAGTASTSRKPSAGDGAQRERDLVVEREGVVRMLRQDVVAQQRRVALMLQDRDVDLRVLLQPGVAGKLEEGQQRQRQRRPRRPRARFIWPGVFSNCCFTHTRFGFSSSDLVSACRASASLFSLRRLTPSHR